MASVGLERLCAMGGGLPVDSKIRNVREHPALYIVRSFLSRAGKVFMPVPRKVSVLMDGCWAGRKRGFVFKHLCFRELYMS